MMVHSGLINQLIKQLVERDPNGRILLSIPDVGPIIASAFVASIGAGQAFNSPKELAVWLGLTPKQFASGNKSVFTQTAYPWCQNGSQPCQQEK